VKPDGRHPATRFELRHYRWDVDKTYIETEFDTLRDLVAAYRQRPEDKRNIPGAPALLRELLDESPGERRVTFVSGSPRQMKRALDRKFALDGIEPDAFILKPNLSNIVKLRLRAVRNHNEPLFEYTLMPTRMRGYKFERLPDLSMVQPVAFSKDTPVMRIPRDDPYHSSPPHDWMDQDLLFDTRNDPKQEENLTDPALIEQMTESMRRLMQHYDAPEEAYRRMGLSLS